MAPSDRRGPRNPVGRPRGGRDSGATRREILRAAERLVSAGGYAGTSMQRVAEAAGITKGTLYHHFPGGKDALLLEVGRAMLERDRRGMEAATAEAHGARERLTGMARWMFARDRRSERMMRDAGRYLAPAPRREMAEHFLRHVYGRVHGVLREGVEDGELREHDSAFVAWAFLGLLSEFGEAREHRHGPGGSPEALADDVVMLLLDGIAASASGAAAG